MKKHWIMVAATIISSSLIISHPLIAQQKSNPSDSTGSKTLDEVVVTANKTPQKQSSTGKVLTVINRRTLEKNSGRSLTQVLNEQAGIIVNGSQNAPGTNQVLYMRGAGSANTLILVDGMPVTDGSGITIEFDLNHIAIDQVERVEILKGAQSTLYGSDAVAGVVNIITRQNQSGKKIGFNGQLAGGTYNTFKGNAGVSGEAGKFNYSVQYNRLQSDGFSAAYDPTGKAGFDKDGIKQDVFNASLAFKASDKWTIRGYGQSSHYKADIDDDALLDDKNNTINNKQKLVGLQSLHSIKKGTLTFNVNFNEISRKYNDPVNNPVGNNDFDPFSGDYKGRSLFAESYLNLALHKHVSLLVGIDYRRNSADITTSYSSLGKDSLEAGMMSAYASFSLKELGRFGTEIGGRFTQHQDFGDAFTYSINPYFYLHKQLKLYASVATAFRAPSLYHLASEYGNPDLSPERSTHYEGGAQFTSVNKMFTARATYFNRRVKDVIVFQSTFTPPYGKYINADKQEDQGIETELRFQPTEKWQITANYTFVDGKINSSKEGKDTSFFNLYRRPKNSINIGTSLQLTSRLNVGAGFRWVDKRQDVYFNPTTYETEQKELDSYYNLDLTASYHLLTFIDVYADFRNITDRQYFDLYGYNSRRFNMMAGVRFKF
jgi:vitamin B12 transporter